MCKSYGFEIVLSFQWFFNYIPVRLLVCWRRCVFCQLQRPAWTAHRLQLFTLAQVCLGIDLILCVPTPWLQGMFVSLLGSVVFQFMEYPFNLRLPALRQQCSHRLNCLSEGKVVKYPTARCRSALDVAGELTVV